VAGSVPAISWSVPTVAAANSSSVGALLIVAATTAGIYVFLITLLRFAPA